MKCEQCAKDVPNSKDYILSVVSKENRKSMRLCWDCYGARRQAMQDEMAANNYIGWNLSRARKAGLPATLTLEQWNETKEYFHWRCAYCCTAWIECFEHFIPLSLGGGTTKWNCVPACYACNAKKNRLHPAVVKRIPKEDIERVRSYLMSFL